MISVVYLASFDRSLKDLPSADRKRASSSVGKLLDYFAGGTKPLGLGLRKLQHDYWEVRAGLDKRVLFRLRRAEALFTAVGNHDDIRRMIR